MELEDQIRRCYDQYGTEGTVIICRSNKQAVQYNQYIKRQVFFSEEELDAGDQVMIVKNNYHWLPEGSTAGFIANGDFAEVQRINRLEEEHGYRFANITLRLTDQEHAEAFEATVHLKPLHEPTPNLPMKEQNTVRELVEADWAGAETASERREGIASDPYFNALQIKFAYALTCHKSQGGQWPAVFIDLGYLTDEMMNKDLMRWLYTAITRATQELFLVNFPPKFLE
jgi:exodeoxyribonuclease-5